MFALLLPHFMMPQLKGARKRPINYTDDTTDCLKWILRRRPHIKLKQIYELLRRTDNNNLVFPKEWRPYIQQIKDNLIRRGFDLDRNYDPRNSFLSPSTCIHLGPDPEETSTTTSPAHQRQTQRTDIMGKKSKSNSRASSTSPPRGSRASSTSPHRNKTFKLDAKSFHTWDPMKKALTAAKDKSKFGEVYEMHWGQNPDISMKPVLKLMKDMEVENSDVTSVFVEFHTQDIHASILRTKFNLFMMEDDTYGIHVLMPTSYEQYIANAAADGPVEEGCKLSVYKKSSERVKARRKIILQIENDGQVHYVRSEIFQMPPLPVNEHGFTLQVCRKYWHDKDDVDGVTGTRLNVSRSLVPGDVTVPGRFIDVVGEGKVPVSTCYFSLQLACEHSEEVFEDDGSVTSSDADSDDELDQYRRMKEAQKKEGGNDKEKKNKKRNSHAVDDSRMDDDSSGDDSSGGKSQNPYDFYG